MFRSIIFAICLLSLSTTSSYAGILEAMQSVCRLQDLNGKDLGSGVAYYAGEESNYIYILTAGHVVEPLETNNCQCVFYSNGRQLAAIPAVVETKDYVKIEKYEKNMIVKDLATLRVNKSKFKSPNDYPKCIPLARPDITIRVGDQIISCGCPGPHIPLNYPSTFNGYITEVLDDAFYFQPNVIEGRSGSPVFNVSGERVIGIVIWKSNWGGRAISSQGIYKHLSKEH
jgi:V8-like Glu-specific endopeptidase